MKPLLDRTYTLEKFPGKGGWTYLRIPHISKSQKVKKVKGSVDGFPISKCHLMWKDKKVFFPVRGEIRRKIKKEAGDKVRVILYPDNDVLRIPKEMILCIQDDPAALQFFTALSESEKKYYIQWVYGAKKEETKVNRMTKMMLRLAHGLKMYDPRTV